MDATKGLPALRRPLAGLLAFLLGCLSLAPVYASDTEVYVRPVDLSGEITPVLMMVLDSSGSMLDCLENCDAGNPARLTRIGALRQSMRTVLFGEPEPGTGGVVKPAPDFIKMGYARFNPDANDGGWMRYPALKLSATVPDSWTVSSSFENRINAGANDVSGSTLGGTSYTVGASMSALGLRFADLQIPRNATITGAMLHFTRASTSGSVPNSLKVATEGAGNSAVFTTDGTTGRNWSADSSLSTDTGPSTFYVNVGSLLQGVVNRGDWCGGNALSLRVTSNGGSRSVSVSSFEGSAGAAPVLIVSYTTATSRTGSCISAPVDVVLGVRSTYDDIEWPEGGSGIDVNYRQPTVYPAAVPDSVRNQVALRFPDVPVIPNATIKSAWLYLTSATSDTAPAPVEVAAFDTDNLAEFCIRNETTKEVTCTPPAVGALTPAAPLTLPGSAANVSVDGVHRALDVSAQVAAVVGRAGWASNNALGFLLRNPGTTNVGSSIYTMDSTLSRSAFLHIVYRKEFSNLDEIDKTARQDLYDDISARMYASGGTPLGDAYAEAARYLLGMAAYSEDVFTTTFNEQAPSQPYYQPDPRTVSAGKYVSPLENTSECSANYIYLMSDGEPNNASNVTNNSKGITDGYNKPCADYSKIPNSSGNSNTNFACMLSVAKHLASGVNQRKAVIRTNTVLFDDTLSGAVVTDMEAVADEDYGKGQFFHAKTSTQLTDSLLGTMTSMINEAGSITAPGVAVNQFNRLTHLDQLYYAMFDPPEDQGARWRGNVKRYRLVFQDVPMADGSVKQTTTIIGQNNKPAIDPATTFFSTEAQSYWSTSVDGNKAVEGGVASMLPLPASRIIYTYLPTYGTEMAFSTLDEVEVADARTLMGLTTDGQVENVINWLKGYSINIVAEKTAALPESIKTGVEPVSSTTKLRNELGGVLHSQPVLVNYGYTSKTPAEAQLDASKQDNMVFFSTMEGMLHAVDANTGIESFAFMPREKLARADEFILNAQQALPEFGMDSTWAVWRVDGNKDQKITPGVSPADKVWLFGGMRMGGRNYYALDVTDRTKPVLKWVKQGGVTAGFTNMGQTWSKPVLGEVKVGGVVKSVLFFAGGYDPKHEGAGYTSANASDAQGNQLYIVDPDTGALLWWASNTGASMNVPAMKYSIPAEPKLFDANKDGLVDAVYFGDLGGQVFRLDINSAASANSEIGKRMHLLATVGQGINANTVNQRRFYEPPSVATLLDPLSNKPYVTVAMGTGYRSHPLDTGTEDYFYVFKDMDVLRADLASADANSLQATIEPTDLATVDLTVTTGADMTGAMGWKMELPEDGEKVLATPIILFGEVFFSTYVPRMGSAASKCDPVIGVSKLWRLSVGDGGITRDTNGDGEVTVEDRFIDTVVKGLGGAPQLIIGDDGKNAVITGTGAIRNQDLNSPGMRRTRWFTK